MTMVMSIYSPFADMDISAQDDSIVKDSDAQDYSQGYSHNDGHDYDSQDYSHNDGHDYDSLDDSPVTDTDSNTGRLDYRRQQSWHVHCNDPGGPLPWAL